MGENKTCIFLPFAVWRVAQVAGSSAYNIIAVRDVSHVPLACLVFSPQN